MDCREAREQILESLAEAGAGEAFTGHVRGCDECRGFLQAQLELDKGLGVLIGAPRPSAQLREFVMRRARLEPLLAWPAFLPDAAHLAGCLCGILVCLLVLPFSAGHILLGGLQFTLLTYFFQTVLRGAWEGWEEGGR